MSRVIYTETSVFPKYLALGERIRQEDYTQAELAKEMGKSGAYISLRMRGKVDWSLSDMQTICKILGITGNEVLKYFPIV